MEVIKRLNIPAPFLYKQIITSVIFDIRKETGKSVNSGRLKGFEYIKNYSKNSRAKIKIEELSENTIYQFRTSTTKNDYVVRYAITPIDEKSCEVRYVETMVSHGILQKINDMVFGLLLMYFKKRQFKRMLQMIEASY